MSVSKPVLCPEDTETSRHADRFSHTTAWARMLALPGVYHTALSILLRVSYTRENGRILATSSCTVAADGRVGPCASAEGGSSVDAASALNNSPVFTRIIADTLGREISFSNTPEASMRGAVLLALETIGKMKLTASKK